MRLFAEDMKSRSTIVTLTTHNGSEYMIDELPKLRYVWGYRKRRLSLP